MTPEAYGMREGVTEAPAASKASAWRSPVTWAAFAVYNVLAVVATWPLARHPQTLTIRNEDVYNSLWVLAWVVRQLFRDPLNLFEANIYYPHTHSLAYLESLVPESLQAAPVLWAGGSPLLAYNVVLLLTFSLSGLGAFLLAWELSGSRSGAFLAGLGYAFCAFRYDHFVHVHCLSIQWLPLSLLYLHRAVRSGRTSDLVLLGVFSLLQALSSGYYALLIALGLGVALVYHALVRTPWRLLLRALLPLLVAAAVSGIMVLPHRAIAERQGLVRTPRGALHWSARWSSYLDPGRYIALPHLTALYDRTHNRAPLYPGAVILVLGAAGLAQARRNGPARLTAILAALGVLLSLGPQIRLGPLVVPGPYELLSLLPGGGIIRVPSRMAVLALACLSVLAAIGWSALTRWRRTSPRTALALALGLATFHFVEAFPVGLAGGFDAIEEPPPSAKWLAQAPRGPVLELPWTDPRLGGLYSYWSTVHWQPMVNGWGSVHAPGNHELGLIGRQWPTRYLSRLYRERGIRYVVVHVDRLQEPQRSRLTRMDQLPDGVSLAAVVGHDWIYVLDPHAELSERGKPKQQG
jgi:hypothetical protein